jgi:hypothetical protein
MATEDVVNGNTVNCTYWSLDELAEAAERRAGRKVRMADSDDDGWSGGSFDQCVSLARTGWERELDAALDVAESAVELAERTHEVMRATETVYDVCGDSVDMGRYMSGEPECMMDWPLQPTSAVGQVITLCASVAYSGAVEPETIRRRGQVIVALALALSRLGHAVELWIDSSVAASHNRESNGKHSRVRVLVKGANDTLDPSRIMFAFAHPGVLRNLMFAVWDGFPPEYREDFGEESWARGYPVKPLRDLPEGTIYLPEIYSDRDVPDAHTALKGYLRDLGLLAE